MIYDNGVYREMTAEERIARDTEQKKAAALEKNRPLTEAEVSSMLIRQQINALDVDDSTALRMKSFYPEWAVNVSYAVGNKVRHGNRLYRVVQSHTSQEGWEPGTVPALWEQIDENYEGTLADPVPYSGSMALENGKHYLENSIFYKCIRDTGNPVYNNLADLVGVYVQEV